MRAGPRSSCHRIYSFLSKLCFFLSLTHAHLYFNHLLLLVKVVRGLPPHLSLSGSPCPIANRWKARTLELPLSPANLWLITFRPTPHSYGGGLGGVTSYGPRLTQIDLVPLQVPTPISHNS